jgi:hypothetical protein
VSDTRSCPRSHVFEAILILEELEETQTTTTTAASGINSTTFAFAISAREGKKARQREPNSIQTPFRSPPLAFRLPSAYARSQVANAANPPLSKSSRLSYRGTTQMLYTTSPPLRQHITHSKVTKVMVPATSTDQIASMSCSRMCVPTLVLVLLVFLQ